MKPGRDLDRAVAEAMGGTALPLDCWDIGGVAYRRWQPSTSRDQARTAALDWLQAHWGGGLTIETGAHLCSIYADDPARGPISVDGDTLEHAICLAVLATRDADARASA